jgi:5-methyltetrahydropteroyltriglutamate--homocysteine methyltransferase
MARSADRILVSHAGTLPRPPEFQELFLGGESTSTEFEQGLPQIVKELVQRQAQIGIDIVNDGEAGKRGGFLQYVRSRLSGIEPRPGRTVPERNVSARDRLDFPGTFAAGIGGFGRFAFGNAQPTSPAAAPAPAVNRGPLVCAEPLAYVGQEQARRDIAYLKEATAGLDVQPYLPAVAPGTIEHWLYNEHYASDEALLFAIADAMREEYRLITAAGVLLQIDDPDLPDGWQMFPGMSVDEYRKYAELRVDALNHALQDIPTELIRLHVCWGSGHGPHRNDLPLEHLADLILKVRAGCYSVEAANPRHEHEWRVWQTTKLPDGATLMPGVVGHATDVVEHPRAVADRLINYARVVGKQNLIAGTDCGVGGRVGHGEIAWAKLEALCEGARIASDELWG